MDDLREPGPEDVVAAAEASYALLSPLAEMDWSVIAGDLEWDCRQTLEHVAFVQLFYALTPPIRLSVACQPPASTIRASL